MCHDPIVQAALLIAGAAVAVIAAILVARVSERCETNRRQRLMDESLTRYEQAQNRWVESPAVDVERRG
jgi:hypothetical protein